MKISEIFNLNVSQYELDFIDIDPDKDTRLFIDPGLIRNRKDALSIESLESIESFFIFFLSLLKSNNEEARVLFNYLHEPNETCLGLSKGKPRGNAIGNKDSDKLFKAIKQNPTVVNSNIDRIEDLLLFVDGIGPDKISDMTTNIIRKNLWEYTKKQCQLWDIPLKNNIETNYCWDNVNKKWIKYKGDSLVIDKKRILLVPKNFVSICKIYTSNGLYDKFILTFLQDDNIKKKSPLVQHRKGKRPFVTKISLKRNGSKYSKDFISQFVIKYPDVFYKFKQWADNNAAKSNWGMIDEASIASNDIMNVISSIKNRLIECLSSDDCDDLYRKVVLGALELLFYPDIVHPEFSRNIVKRNEPSTIFDNVATEGFFYNLVHKYKIIRKVECISFPKKTNKKEIDRLFDEISVDNKVPVLLVFKGIDDVESVLIRCKDTFIKTGSIVFPLTTDDLSAMLDNIVDEKSSPYDKFFVARLNKIVSYK